MKVFNKIAALQNALFDDRKAGKSVGLVPTMGALHEGHASLVRRSVSENDVTVVSVFLNPTQFNDKGDLDRYPRTLEADCQLLESVGADYVLAPSVEEMYPVPDTRQFEFPPVSTVMEGAKRPGHFNGVCQVVSRLFYIVRPDRAYFGEKDWQQIAVVKQLVKYIGMNIDIVECDIVRDADGLAKSSRNTLLAPNERAIAPAIYEALKRASTMPRSTRWSKRTIAWWPRLTPRTVWRWSISKLSTATHCCPWQVGTMLSTWWAVSLFIAVRHPFV